MALGDLMASRFSQSSSPSVSNHLDEFSGREHSGDVGSAAVQRREQEAGVVTGVNPVEAATTSMAYLPQTVVFCDFRHEGFEDCVPLGPSESGLVSKWRPKDRVRCYPSLIFVVCLFIANFVFFVVFDGWLA